MKFVTTYHRLAARFFRFLVDLDYDYGYKNLERWHEHTRKGWK